MNFGIIAGIVILEKNMIFQVIAGAQSQEQISRNQAKERAGKISAIKDGLVESDGKSSFSSKIKLQETEYQANIVINNNGTYSVTVTNYSSVENGTQRVTSMTFNYNSENRLESKSGSRPLQILPKDLNSEIVSVSSSFTPDSEIGDRAIEQLKAERVKSKLPAVR